MNDFSPMKNNVIVILENISIFHIEFPGNGMSPNKLTTVTFSRKGNLSYKISQIWQNLMNFLRNIPSKFVICSLTLRSGNLEAMMFLGSELISGVPHQESIHSQSTNKNSPKSLDIQLSHCSK